MFATELPDTPKPRRPLFALLLSLVLPGFGQLYNGQVNKALWLYLIFSLLTLPMMVFIALYLPNGLMLPVLVVSLLAVLGIWFYGMWDAWRTAQSLKTYQLKTWQYSSVYWWVFILCNLIIFPLLSAYIRTHQVEAFYIPSASMNPTLKQGDLLFADKCYNCPNCEGAVQRGDIAIFTYPNDRSRYYIKRIIGLPNDKIQLQGQTISINGKALTQAAQQGLITESVDTKMWQVQWQQQTEGFKDSEFIVPAGQVFVLGDNRSHSTDSREFGTVPLSDVVGKARQVWFSKHDGDIDWQRLGLTLQ
ncbi:signal peptidase I [Thiolinea disciformis]|uniref:signal peptidase I n=1 Tax=Thiolinea disciformis TaxID=125614 RepID=UPI00036B6087|nr:signal peptidase I [Thiolinea disciformis]